MDIIEKIFADNYDNYNTCEFPKDRRMSILEENGVKGMSTENVRFAINEIVRQFAKNGLYVEVGSWKGCSLMSAALNNDTTCIGIDNFSQWDTKNKTDIKNGIEKLCLENASIIEGCYKNIIPKYLENKKVDVYFYDGNHSYEDQLNGLNIILPYITDKTIILVDDVVSSNVYRANDLFAEQNGFTQFRIGELDTKTPSNWWYGFEVIYKL